jgi:hypothetical protein
MDAWASHSSTAAASLECRPERFSSLVGTMEEKLATRWADRSFKKVALIRGKVDAHVVHSSYIFNYREQNRENSIKYY